MYYQQFAATILATLNRNAEDLVINGQDLVLIQANAAKRSLESRLDFEFLRTTVTLTVNTVTGASLDDVVDINNEITDISVNRIERAFLKSDGRLIPLKLMSGSAWNVRFEQARGFANERTTEANTVTDDILDPENGAQYILMRRGNKVYFHTGRVIVDGSSGTDKEVVLDIVRYSQPYTTDLYTASVEMAYESVIFPCLGSSATFGMTSSGYWNNQPLFVSELTLAGVYFYVWYNGTNWYLSNAVGKTDRGYMGGTAPRDFAYTGFTYVGPASPAPIVHLTISNVNIADTTEGFFLQDCYNYMFYYVMRHLEYHNRSNYPFQITQKMLDDAMQDVVSWNGSIAEHGNSGELLF